MVERQAQWLVRAIRLVLLRSRLMLPNSPLQAQDAQRDAAQEEQRLRMRAALVWLEARPQPPRWRSPA